MDSCPTTVASRASTAACAACAALLAFSSLLLTTSCSEDAPADDAIPADANGDIDLVEDSTSSDTAADDTTDDMMLPAGCEPLPEFSGEPILRGGSCRTGQRCERGTVCDPGECKVWVGCARLTPTRSTEACLVGTTPGGISTQIECTCDEQCADSPHGEYCILGACHGAPPCDDDGTCPAGTECYDNRVCLAPEEQP